MKKIVSHSRMYLERERERERERESERKITTRMDGRRNSLRQAKSREQHQPKRHGNKPC
jgi:hypothetical protein